MTALPVSDRALPVFGHTLDAYRGLGGTGESRGHRMAVGDLGSFLVRVDAEGRVQRSPAAMNLAEAARLLCDKFPSACPGLAQALAEFDRESELLDALVSEGQG